MTKYVYFKKNNLTTLLSDGNEITAPALVNKSTKNYRFNVESNILEKKCIECNSYFEVQKNIDGKFIDIHDETLIHYLSEVSGYNGRCKKCVSEDNVSMTSGNFDDFINKNNILLSTENLMYIQILSLLKDSSVDDTLNFIVNIVRKHNKIEYNEKIS